MPNWSDVLGEIRELRDAATRESSAAADMVRRQYLDQLYKKTGRNVIAYYSGWLSKPGVAQTDINDEDMNGFMMAVHRLDRRQGLDLILHTPGGNMAATQAIVEYLHKMFSHDIRAIVPQIAMSAGTMIACSSHTILMAKHSSLGPTDPLINGIPAAGVVDEFARAVREVKDDPAKMAFWHAIISQYPPTFLSQCENSLEWARSFVREQLETVMFAKDTDPKSKAAQVVAKLTDYSGNKSHSRHISYDECVQIGLNVHSLEADDDLQDLILTVHHCFMHALMNTASFKMIENHLGVALVKQQQIQQVLIPAGQ